MMLIRPLFLLIESARKYDSDHVYFFVTTLHTAVVYYRIKVDATSHRTSYSWGHLVFGKLPKHLPFECDK